MLAEIFLVLAGHPSSLFLPSPPIKPTTYIVAPSLEEYLHPGEVASLHILGQLAFRYREIRQWAIETCSAARSAVFTSISTDASRKCKSKADLVDHTGPGVYLATLASSILDVLGEYEMEIINLEKSVLDSDPSLVQDGERYVPLGTLVAKFDHWQYPLQVLHNIIEDLSPSSSSSTTSPGVILDKLRSGSQTGNPRLVKIFHHLQSPVEQLWLTHLVIFILLGQAPPASTPSNPAIGIDLGPDPTSPHHRSYGLVDDMFPNTISQGTKDSILYIGRVAATLAREGKSFPGDLITPLREILMTAGMQDGLSEAIKQTRSEVGEWLWKHILTGSQVTASLEAFGNYFLTRNGEYALSHIREIHRLRLAKLVTGNPHSSSSIIRNQDLNTALLRASVGTSAETDPVLEKIYWVMENGPLRPLLPSSSISKSRSTPSASNSTSESSLKELFSSSLLGTPLTLSIRVEWPLDLFITPSNVSAYSEIQAYLYAFRDTHLRVLDTWTSLSSAQRQRRKWTGDSEGGIDEEAKARKELGRKAWGLIRGMLFFLDQMQSHFMLDIIEVQHRRLIEELGDVDVSLRESRALAGSTRSLGGLSERTKKLSLAGLSERPSSPLSSSPGTQTRSRLPPTPKKQAPNNTFLDFLTLRQMHNRHLSFLKEGLLLSDIPTATLIRDILDICKRFTSTVERWGGDVIPPLLEESEEDKGGLVRERSKAIQEVDESLHEHLSQFFRILLESQNPPAPTDTSVTAAGASFSRTAKAMQLSRVMSRQISFAGPGGPPKRAAGGRSKDQIEKDERSLETEALMGRHIEQLLLRLDFNGVLTDWMAEEDAGATGRNVLPARTTAPDVL